jgi:hypothetical protein
MENFLKKIMSVTKTDIEKLREALKASPICKPMNDLVESKLDTDGGGQKIRIHLNPNNQKCFNFGWFEYQDYYDWLEGKGKIVKGKTDEEKKKFWDVAVFENENDYAWAFGYYKKHFGLIDETYRTQIQNGLGYWTFSKKPLKITKDNHKEIIAKVFGNVCRYYGDTCVKPENGSHMRKMMHDELVGVKETLFALGIGYYGACNTPEEPENLAWIADICEYKSAYLYYINNKIPLPDFDFVYNYDKHGK